MDKSKLVSYWAYTAAVQTTFALQLSLINYKNFKNKLTKQASINCKQLRGFQNNNYHIMAINITKTLDFKFNFFAQILHLFCLLLFEKYLFYSRLSVKWKVTDNKKGKHYKM